MINAPSLPVRIRRHTVESPLGCIRLLATEQGLLRLDFADGRGADDQAWLARLCGPFEIDDRPDDGLHAVAGQLAAYWRGSLAHFDLALDLRGTPFQKRVWCALTKIPIGTTLAYHALAAQIGHPAAVRAVGAANGANPISIIVACHRLLSADGTLRAYGGGLHRKQALLEHERRYWPDPGLE